MLWFICTLQMSTVFIDNKQQLTSNEKLIK